MRYQLGLLLLLGIMASCEAPPTCIDGIMNGAEADVDCGGGCGKCGDGRACLGASDCLSGVCKGAICRAPSCTDAVKNGSEVDVDCGFACGKCGEGKACLGASDCLSGVCEGTVCRAPSCTDGIKNGSESDVDCGGTCGRCANGKACVAATGCQSAICRDGVCSAPRCIDTCATVCVGEVCQPPPTGNFLQVYQDMEQPAMGCTGPAAACHGTNMPLALTKYKTGGATDMVILMTTFQEVRKSVNLAQPAESLFLTKVLKTRPDIAHLGGKTYFMSDADPVYQRWLSWIKAGATF